MKGIKQCAVPDVTKATNPVAKKVQEVINFAEARKTAWESCVTKSHTYIAKDKECNTAINAFEDSFCDERSDYITACDEYEKLYDQAEATLNAELTLVEKSMKDRKSMIVQIESLKCMVAALQKPKAEIHAAFDHCRTNAQSQAWQKSYQDNYHLTKPPLPENLECTGHMLKAAFHNFPGTVGWKYNKDFSDSELPGLCKTAERCSTAKHIYDAKFYKKYRDLVGATYW